MRRFDIVLSDLGEILKAKRSKIFFATLLAAFIGLSWGVTRPLNYIAEATFRDKAKADSGIRQSMSDLILGGASDKHDSEAISAMRSARLMEALIKKRGLQASISEKESSFPTLKKIKNNLVVEWAYFKNHRTPSLKDPKKSLGVFDIHYAGEIYQPLELTFLDEHRYQVKKGSEGRVGEPYSDKDFQFTLKKLDDQDLSGRTFSVTLLPIKNVSRDLSSQLSAKTDSDDRALIRIRYQHPERHEAVSFVNTLMSVYQDYLEAEHARVSEAQLDYLKDREKEIGSNLKKVMDEHAQTIRQDLKASGFTDSKKELEFLSGQLLATTQKLMQINLDEKRLENVIASDIASFDQSSPGSLDAPIINELLHKIRDLKLSQDSLTIAVKDKKGEVLSDQDKGHFQGVSLSAAKDIYLSLARDRQDNEAAIKQLDFVIKQLESPDFEITSLTAVLSDPVSHEKIMKASQLSHSLKDTTNRTSRELERIEQELRVQKQFLKTHLSETAKLLDLKAGVLDNKNYVLQLTMLEMSAREIALLEKQLSDYRNARLANFNIEKQLIEKHQNELKAQLTNLPEKWMKEQLLDQHLLRHQRMGENVAMMVESKNISSNLELVQSAPLDLAVAPLHPKAPRLMVMTVAGAIFGLIMASLFFLAKGILNEVPITLGNLAVNGFKTTGSLFYRKRDSILPLFDSNLDTLRRSLAYFPAEKMALLGLHGSGPDFSDTVSDLLKKRGEKTLRVNLSFNNEDPQPGIKQYLEKQASLDEIIHDGVIYSGGFDRYANELINHDGFKTLLTELKKRCDWVVASSPASLASAEAESLILLFDATLMAVSNETLNELSPLLNELEPLRSEKPIAFLKYQLLA